MSLERGFSWSYQDWNFVGYSIAGITTSIFCKNASACFDVGQGMPFQNGARRIFLTHGHLDHAAGIPYLVAQKNMMGQKDTHIYAPPSLVEPLGEILKIWQRIDDHDYRYELSALSAGERIELDRQFAVEPFGTVHRVPSQGYLLYQKRKRLREEWRGASPEDIRAERVAGRDPNEEFWEPVVAFTGDTKIEFIDQSPAVAEAKILFVEVTFWDEAKPVEHARSWGHIHLEELLVVLPRLRCERIVLIHASIRYTTRQLREILDRRLSAADRERVVIFPRPI